MSVEASGLGKATRRVLADEVTDEIREAIIRQELEPGRKLAEDDLAAQLGVSRGPIREALMRLEREGLVTSERHRGSSVAVWTKQDVEEIYSMRGALEELAIEWACQYATEEDIKNLQAVMDNYSSLKEKARTPATVRQLDLEFHSILFESSHHERLLESWLVLRSQINASLFFRWSKADNQGEAFLPNWGLNHQTIVDLIVARKPEPAKKAIRTHVEDGFSRVAQYFQE